MVVLAVAVVASAIEVVVVVVVAVVIIVVVALAVAAAAAATAATEAAPAAVAAIAAGEAAPVGASSLPSGSPQLARHFALRRSRSPITILSSMKLFSSSTPICLRVMFRSWNFYRSSDIDRVFNYNLILPHIKL